MDKKSLSERDICSKYIAPAVQRAGWDMHRQVREEVSFTKGRIILHGKLRSRGESGIDFHLTPITLRNNAGSRVDISHT